MIALVSKDSTTHRKISLVMRIFVPLLFIVLFLGMASLAAGECTGKILLSDRYEDEDCFENFDHSEDLSGNHLIDKITKIEVFTGPYRGFEVSPYVVCISV